MIRAPPNGSGTEKQSRILQFQKETNAIKTKQNKTKNEAIYTFFSIRLRLTEFCYMQQKQKLV